MATPETQTKANPALMKGLSFISGKDLYLSLIHIYLILNDNFLALLAEPSLRRRSTKRSTD